MTVSSFFYTSLFYGILLNLHLWRDSSLWECMFYIFVVILRNSTEFTFMKRFFMRMRVLPFLRNYGEILCDNDRFILFLHVIILRNSTKFAFMKRFFFMRMHVFPFFYGILRNSAELAFMGRFLMRMHVLHFLRNSTEFNGIWNHGEILCFFSRFSVISTEFAWSFSTTRTRARTSHPYQCTFRTD